MFQKLSFALSDSSEMKKTVGNGLQKSFLLRSLRTVLKGLGSFLFGGSLMCEKHFPDHRSISSSCCCVLKLFLHLKKHHLASFHVELLQGGACFGKREKISFFPVFCVVVCHPHFCTTKKRIWCKLISDLLCIVVREEVNFHFFSRM